MFWSPGWRQQPRRRRERLLFRWTNAATASPVGLSVTTSRQSRRQRSAPSRAHSHRRLCVSWIVACGLRSVWH